MIEFGQGELYYGEPIYSDMAGVFGYSWGNYDSGAGTICLQKIDIAAGTILVTGDPLTISPLLYGYITVPVDNPADGKLWMIVTDGDDEHLVSFDSATCNIVDDFDLGSDAGEFLVPTTGQRVAVSVDGAFAALLSGTAKIHVWNVGTGVDTVTTSASIGLTNSNYLFLCFDSHNNLWGYDASTGLFWKIPVSFSGGTPTVHAATSYSAGVFGTVNQGFPCDYNRSTDLVTAWVGDGTDYTAVTINATTDAIGTPHTITDVPLGLYGDIGYWRDTNYATFLNAAGDSLRVFNRTTGATTTVPGLPDAGTWELAGTCCDAAGTGGVLTAKDTADSFEAYFWWGVNPDDPCIDISGYTDSDLPSSEDTVDATWPVDLQPRNAGINPMFASLSGGPSLLGLEPAVANAAGFWRFSFEAIPVNTKSRVLAFREIAAKLDGRIGVCLVPLFDGKRAPQGAAAIASGAMARGATSGAIQFSAGGPPRPGMHFSAGERMYRLTTVGAALSGDTYPVTFWPPVRTAIANGATLDFATPHCRMRLATDDAMTLTLQDLKFGSANIDWVEDI